MGTLWHTLSIEQVFEQIDSQEGGLSEDSAQSRLKKYGHNILPEKGRDSVAVLFLSQFNNPLILILLGVLGVSFYLGHTTDAIFIIIVLLANTAVGFYQEVKADRSLYALKKVIKTNARVLRDRKIKQIDSGMLVPGDIIYLRAGDKIPADARVLRSRGAMVDESSLTGEWIPISKCEDETKEEATLGDRKNMFFTGTLLVEGEGSAVVVETGSHTAFGNIVEIMQDTKERKTPLQKRLAHLSRVLGIVILGLIALITIAGYLRGQPSSEIFTAALALVVSSIPAGVLPTITLILVLGMNRILKERGLVRKLVASETLGSVTVICTDKTGTLTEGKMNVSHILASSEELLNIGEGTSPHEVDKGSEAHILALKIGLFTNDAFIENHDDELKEWIIRGGFTEKAIVIAAAHAGIDKRLLDREYPTVEHRLFDSITKYAVSVREVRGERVLYVTGAPEVVLERAISLHLDQRGINTDDREVLLQKLDSLAVRGLRVVACGYRILSPEVSLTDIPALVEKLSFVGFIAIKDPLRTDARQSILETKRAGIRTIIVTGDHRHTAFAVGEDIGLITSDKEIIEGKDIDCMSDEELRVALRNITICARVSPSHKLRIVRALQSNNEVVAMIGDGVNDAPAIKAADVGVAIGSGTDVAREVADIVLLDDNFKAIVKAIEQGRLVFENIRKVFVYLIAVDVAELSIFLFAMMVGMPVPLLAAQILWINLVEDGLPDIALSLEQETKEVMLDRPRPLGEPILHKPLRFWVIVIFIVTGATAALSFPILLRLTGNLEETRTLLFVLMSLDALIFSLSVRSFKKPILRKDIFSNKFLNISILFGLGLTIVAIYIPFLQKILSTKPPPTSYWGIILGISVIEIAIIEYAKKLLFQTKQK